MKKVNQIALLLSAGVFLVAMSFGTAKAQAKPKGKEWKVADADAKKKSAVKNDDEATIKAGKDVWNVQCKSCHGAKGLGDGPKAEKIDISCGDFTSAETAKKTDGELFWKATEGRKPMPSYKEKLSDSERWKVISYIRTL